MTGLRLGEEEGERWVDELLFKLELAVTGKRSFFICGDLFGEGSAERGRRSMLSNRDGRFFVAVKVLSPKSTVHVAAGEGHSLSLELDMAWTRRSSLADSL